MTNESPASSREIGLIERAFLMGIGAASIAKQKAEDLAEELVVRGAITREESQSFANRLADEAARAGRTAGDTVAREAGQVIGGMGLASKDEVAALRAEITELKELIAEFRPLTDDVPRMSSEDPAEG